MRSIRAFKARVERTHNGISPCFYPLWMRAFSKKENVIECEIRNYDRGIVRDRPYEPQ
jgi:hypothetical protein